MRLSSISWNLLGYFCNNQLGQSHCYLKTCRLCVRFTVSRWPNRFFTPIPPIQPNRSQIPEFGLRADWSSRFLSGHFFHLVNLGCTQKLSPIPHNSIAQNGSHKFNWMIASSCPDSILSHYWGEIKGVDKLLPSQEPGSVHLSTLKESTQAWLTDRKIKGFYTGLFVLFDLQ